MSKDKLEKRLAKEGLPNLNAIKTIISEVSQEMKNNGFFRCNKIVEVGHLLRACMNSCDDGTRNRWHASLDNIDIPAYQVKARVGQGYVKACEERVYLAQLATLFAGADPGAVFCITHEQSWRKFRKMHGGDWKLFERYSLTADINEFVDEPFLPRGIRTQVAKRLGIEVCRGTFNVAFNFIVANWKSFNYQARVTVALNNCFPPVIR